MNETNIRRPVSRSSSFVSSDRTSTVRTLLFPIPLAPRGSGVGAFSRTGSSTFPVSRSGYTLIELLAVMAIIAIIMLIAVAAYTGISRAAAPRKAAENIESALSLARQYAVAKNRPVLFLLLDGGFNARNAGTDPYGWDISTVGPTRGRHFATFDPSNRVYVTGWTELPQGVVFDQNSYSTPDPGRNVFSSPADMFYNRQPPPGPAMIPFPRSEDTNRLVTLPGIAFKTDGTVYVRGGDTPGSRRVNVAEGSVDSAGTVTVHLDPLNLKKYVVKVSMLGHAVVEENRNP